MVRTLVAFVFVMVVSACGGAWSEADVRALDSYCRSVAGEHAVSCDSWIDGIHRLSDCDVTQARQVIDQIIAEYNGAPALSIAEGYEKAGCEYGPR